MGNLEALGDALTGGVIGRAVEPTAGEASEGHTQAPNCLNCGAPLAGPYCHECGQHAHVHRTLTAFFHDFAHGVLHFEGKIWRTVPMLAFHPGELTRRYIDGQRARFVSPIALFLFCVFFMFAVMGLTGGLDRMARPPSAAKVQAEIAAAQKQVVSIEAERAQAAKQGKLTPELDSRFRRAQMKVARLQWEPGPKIETHTIQLSDDTPTWVRNPLRRAAQNPELLFYKLKTNAYKFSWALIPISVPFVWLLFPFSRRFRLYDHTVFVTYSLCFMMLLLVVGSTLGLVLPSIASLAWFIPPIHMYRQIRGTYGTTRLGAIWRTAALTIFAFIAIVLFTVLLFGLDAVE